MKLFILETQAERTTSTIIKPSRKRGAFSLVEAAVTARIKATPKELGSRSCVLGQSESHGDTLGTQDHLYEPRKLDHVPTGIKRR